SNLDGVRLLIIETSGRRGSVALALGPRLIDCRELQETRRHARDLAPAAAHMLEARGWPPTSLDAVLVSRGPGSYTGLRIGIISAKVLAYATGARLVAVETFRAIALQAGESLPVEVVADAQQDQVYVQGFERSGGGIRAVSELTIRPLQEW